MFYLKGVYCNCLYKIYFLFYALFCLFFIVQLFLHCLYCFINNDYIVAYCHYEVHSNDNITKTDSDWSNPTFKSYHSSAIIFFCSLTVDEHLWFYASLKGMPASEIAPEVEKYVVSCHSKTPMLLLFHIRTLDYSNSSFIINNDINSKSLLP